jgi:calcium-dependent protein kinase
MQHTGLKGSIEPLLEEADIDKDGKISLSEFRKLLRTASMSNIPSPRGVPNPQASVNCGASIGEEHLG